MSEQNGEITQLLERWNSGDRDAYERLMPLVYDQLRHIAHRLDVPNAGQTLQPTAIVHELYLKLVDSASRNYASRQHFFALAARAMRQIVVDNGRRAMAGKRGAGLGVLPFDEKTILPPVAAHDVVALDDALKDLEGFDRRKARLVELRYFAGLRMEELAEAEGISTETVRREMRLAEAWLAAYLRRDDKPDAGLEDNSAQ